MRKKWICVALAAFVVAALVWVSSASAKNNGNDRVLSKVTFIHYRKGHGKPDGTPGKGGGGGGGNGGGKKEPEGYYTYLARGAKWRVVEPYLFNPRSDDNPGGQLVRSAILAGMGEWETPNGTVLDIYGELTKNLNVTYDGGSFREYNTISFEDLENPGVIAIAAVWGYFGGPPGQRSIIEAHVVLNDYFVWGDAVAEPELMDIQNIVTHELGHVAGMGDLYKSAAGEETMYGESTEGEIKKRDLYLGDSAGVISLYE